MHESGPSTYLDLSCPTDIAVVVRVRDVSFLPQPEVRHPSCWDYLSSFLFDGHYEYETDRSGRLLSLQPLPESGHLVVLLPSVLELVATSG